MVYAGAHGRGEAPEGGQFRRRTGPSLGAGRGQVGGDLIPGQ